MMLAIYIHLISIILFLRSDYDRHLPFKPTWLDGWIGMQIFTHTLLLAPNLSLTYSSVQTSWTVTTILGIQNWYLIRCRLPITSNSTWL